MPTDKEVITTPLAISHDYIFNYKGNTVSIADTYYRYSKLSLYIYIYIIFLSFTLLVQDFG